MNLEHVDILGVPFVHATRSQFVDQLQHHINAEQKAFVITANPEIVMKANEEPSYMKVVEQATYVTADGIGVVKAAKLLNKPLPERVAGYDVMMDLLQLADRHQHRVYLLGARQETLEKAERNVGKQFPQLKIVGSHNGFFDWKSRHIQQEIAEKRPDLIFVALGVPRQENWIAENIHQFDKGVFVGVGGSFDVIAGTVKRAPEIWQRMNLEWFYRLLKQPSRFGRMMALPRFAFKILAQKARS